MGLLRTNTSMYFKTPAADGEDRGAAEPRPRVLVQQAQHGVCLPLERSLAAQGMLVTSGRGRLPDRRHSTNRARRDPAPALGQRNAALGTREQG